MASKIVGVRIPDDLLQAIDAQGDGNRSETILRLLKIGLQHLGDVEQSNDVKHPVQRTVKQEATQDVIQAVLQAVRQELPAIVRGEVEELGK